MQKGLIDGVLVKPLTVYADGRGSLIETWRMDTPPFDARLFNAGGGKVNALTVERETHVTLHGPVMSYLSWTKPDKVRGFHQHRDQVDHFYFCGPSVFKVVLFDDREESMTRGNLMEVFAGAGCPKYVMVPHMVYHGYKNVGTDMGLVINYPDSLFKGWQQAGKIDEIRTDPHENPFGYNWSDRDN